MPTFYMEVNVKVLYYHSATAYLSINSCFLPETRAFLLLSSSFSSGNFIPSYLPIFQVLSLHILSTKQCQLRVNFRACSECLLSHLVPMQHWRHLVVIWCSVPHSFVPEHQPCNASPDPNQSNTVFWAAAVSEGKLYAWIHTTLLDCHSLSPLSLCHTFMVNYWHSKCIWIDRSVAPLFVNIL